jgi:hypothetical protein
MNFENCYQLDNFGVKAASYKKDSSLNSPDLYFFKDHKSSVTFYNVPCILLRFKLITLPARKIRHIKPALGEVLFLLC